MPLSPILANLVLSEFDNRIERHELKMVRYADDIAVFFRTKHEAQEGHRFISDALAQIKLTVPGLGDDSKTQLLGPSDPIGFLGLEIVRVGSDNRAVRRVPKKQIQKIVKRLEDEYTLKARLNTDSNFQETVVELWNSIAAYLSSYKGTYNYLSLDSSLRAASSRIIRDIFLELFGDRALVNITPDQKRFLGMSHVDFDETASDLFA